VSNLTPLVFDEFYAAANIEPLALAPIQSKGPIKAYRLGRRRLRGEGRKNALEIHGRIEAQHGKVLFPTIEPCWQIRLHA
jgi:hypothetical protein